MVGEGAEESECREGEEGLIVLAAHLDTFHCVMLVRNIPFVELDWVLLPRCLLLSFRLQFVGGYRTTFSRLYFWVDLGKIETYRWFGDNA